MATEQSPREINFTQYDALGFDMDFTLARYELVPFFDMVYDEVCKFLVNEKHYEASIFHSLAEEQDLIYKGLIAHFATGNILKLGHDGTILRASHGTKIMTKSEIIAVYGEDRKFVDLKSLKHGLKSEDSSWRLFENYFDIPALVAFAKIIDYKTGKESQCSSDDYQQIWKDVYNSLEALFTPSNFAANTGGYFHNIKAGTSKYIDRISSQIKSWLTQLRQDGRIVFLLTSSYPDYAHFVMESVFGQDWKSFFDICLYGARKPLFFTDTKAFIELDGLKTVGEVDTLRPGVEYYNGNCKTLMSFLSELSGKVDPKVLYFGDNLGADAWPTTQLVSWDCVLILEEMDAEGYAVSDGTVPEHADQLEDPNLPAAKQKRRFEHSSLITAEETELMDSKIWGSVFIDNQVKSSTPNVINGQANQELKMNTALGCLISMYTTICAPSIEYLAGIPVDHNFSTFGTEHGNALGFHPGRPRSLLPS